MRTLLVQWLRAHGLPGWIAPDYFTMVALGSLLGAAVALRLARRDGADPHVAARAMAVAYASALVGGQLFEVLRAVPAAVLQGSLAPLFATGRTAYGGLIAGTLGATLYLLRARSPGLTVGAFFDRASVGTGLIFGFVRVGCFLAGCDYGAPTASPLGVRFPPGSLAAYDHATRGWVPPGAPSLPVHATELYESLVGFTGALVAALVLRYGGRRDGRAFLALLAVYAPGRFALEFYRGDESRGLYGALSTSQWVSVAILAALPFLWLAARATNRRASDQQTSSPKLPRSASTAALAALVAVCAPARAHAADDPPAPYAPAPQGYGPPPYAQQPAPYGPPQGAGTPSVIAPTPSPAVAARARLRIDTRLALFYASGSGRVPDGMGIELSGAWHVRAGTVGRLELGIELRGIRNGVATHLGAGPTVGFTFETATALEITTRISPLAQLLLFDSPYFNGTNAWGLRGEVGLQGLLGSRVWLGGTPVAFALTDGATVGTLLSWEPRLWVAVGF